MATDPTTKILIVDDDPAIRNLVHRFLRQKDYHVEAAADGKSALELFERFNPALVILDVNLPDALGYNLCEEMQKRTDVFVLMLTSRTDTEDKAIGFRKGADDYLTKPFDLQELELRVSAILKRIRPVSQPVTQKLLQFENLTIDPLQRAVQVNGSEVPFTTLEFDLLYYLAKNPNQALSRAQLISEVWDYDESSLGDQRVVDVHIGQIRKKIEANASQPSLITTIRGFGYKFNVANADA
ncbi:response regulator transcription factor [Spirulina major]|uniref:response regulator transcription factor n=1 Tax=Spirulina major TaxID=270636 RepID=UPI00093291EF|nr:response regulator transcription factor [Spirulina major]